MKLLLLGMNNPLSDDPEFDLFPYPEGSAGWRLWKMLPGSVTRREYLKMFDRMNLLRSREWSQVDARAAAAAIVPKLRGRLVVVLGTQVRAALGLPLVRPLERTRTVLPTTPSGDAQVALDWLAIPHPSGRNRWYNEPGNRERTGAMLLELARRAA